MSDRECVTKIEAIASANSYPLSENREAWGMTVIETLLAECSIYTVGVEVESLPSTSNKEMHATVQKVPDMQTQARAFLKAIALNKGPKFVVEPVNS